MSDPSDIALATRVRETAQLFNTALADAEKAGLEVKVSFESGNFTVNPPSVWVEAIKRRL